MNEKKKKKQDGKKLSKGNELYFSSTLKILFHNKNIFHVYRSQMKICLKIFGLCFSLLNSFYEFLSKENQKKKKNVSSD